jgi:hypothetical protein
VSDRLGRAVARLIKNKPSPAVAASGLEPPPALSVVHRRVAGRSKRVVDALFPRRGVKRIFRVDLIEAARHAGAESSYWTAEGGASKPDLL